MGRVKTRVAQTAGLDYSEKSVVFALAGLKWFWWPKTERPKTRTRPCAERMDEDPWTAKKRTRKGLTLPGFSGRADPWDSPPPSS